MSNVLVIFQADTEATEQMALAVGVGAVEAEANIRLRRLAAPGAAEVAHKGYGKLQLPDLHWANTVVVGLESPSPRVEDLEGLFSLLSPVHPAQLSGRHAWTFGPHGPLQNQTEAQIVVESSLKNADLIVLPATDLHFAAGNDMISQMKEAGRISARLTSFRMTAQTKAHARSSKYWRSKLRFMNYLRSSSSSRGENLNLISMSRYLIS